MNRFCFLLMALLPAIALFAQEKSYMSVLQNAIEERDHAFDGRDKLIIAEISVFENGQQISQRIMNTFIQGSAQVVYTKRHNGTEIIFLQKDEGYWIFQQGTRRPLKISPSYKMEGDVELWEVLGEKLSRNYELKNITLMEDGQSIKGEMSSIAKGIPYPFMEIYFDTHTSTISRLIFKSLSNHPVKETTISEYNKLERGLLPTLTIKKLISNSLDQHTVYNYISVSKQTLPRSLLQPNASSLEALIRKIKGLL